MLTQNLYKIMKNNHLTCPIWFKILWGYNLFRIMRLSVLLILIASIQVIAEPGYSQNARLSFKMEDVTVKEVLEKIELNSEFYFLYSSKMIDVNRKVNIQARNDKIKPILASLFKDNNVEYHIIDRQIILSPSGLMKSEVVEKIKQQQQQIEVSGTVRDAQSGDPLPGVNIVIEGTTQGTTTDMDGNYTIETPPDATLLFSFVGYQQKSVKVQGREEIDVSLRQSVTELEEVVAIGYGTQRKSDLTGAVASVSSEELTKMATTSSAEALQGQVAGVSVTRESGMPGSSTSINIRGIGTTNNTSPLYVVDGLPTDNIDYLNPEDIQSMEILKDASATAIYGSRGANGVILITTKEGEEGVLEFNFKAYYGLERLENKPNMLNAQQYATLSNTAYENAGEDPIYSNPGNLDYNTNWYDKVSRLGTVQNYNLSVSGGKEQLTSFLSANYYSREGIIKTTDFERLSLNQKSQIQITDFFNIETVFRGVFGTNHSINPTTIFLSSLIAPPDVPIIDPETDYYTGISKIRLANPMGRLARNNSESKRNDLIGNVKANLSITDNLEFQSKFGLNYRTHLNSNFIPSYFETADISSTLNEVSRFTSKMTDWTWDNTLTYDNTFNEVHDLTVMGTVSAREFFYENINASKQNVPIEQERFWYLGAATENPQTNGDANSLSMLSYLGRINYSFDNRYLLTLSLRADGSSRFLSDNKWGIFPSGAFAWKISEEDFFNFEMISNAKLRLGYGAVGNKNIA